MGCSGESNIILIKTLGEEIESASGYDTGVAQIPQAMGEDASVFLIDREVSR